MHTILDYCEKLREQMKTVEPEIEKDLELSTTLASRIVDEEILKEMHSDLETKIKYLEGQKKKIADDKIRMTAIKNEYVNCDEITKAHIDSLMTNLFNILHITLDEEDGQETA